MMATGEKNGSSMALDPQSTLETRRGRTIDKIASAAADMVLQEMGVTPEAKSFTYDQLQQATKRSAEVAAATLIILDENRDILEEALGGN